MICFVPNSRVDKTVRDTARAGGRSPRINRAIERVGPDFRSPITNITNGRAWCLVFDRSSFFLKRPDTVTCRWFTSTRCGRTHQFALPILRLIGHRSVIRGSGARRKYVRLRIVRVRMEVSIYTHYPERFRSHTLFDTRVSLVHSKSAD